MGQIRKRGEIYWIRYYRAGKRHEESTRSSKRGDAERLLKLREGDVAKGVPITPAIGRLTLTTPPRTSRTNTSPTVADRSWAFVYV